MGDTHMRASFSLMMIAIFLMTFTSAFKLRVLKLKIADEKSAGMDGPFFFNFGGKIKLKICLNQMCCQTSDRLNTEDNNWERGETNYFVGRQLQECENFELPSKNQFKETSENVVDVTLQHSGRNGIKIETVEMRGSLRHGPTWTCHTGIKLDNDDEKTFPCFLDVPKLTSERRCNGKPEFCRIPFNKFLFPGSHNAGTGEGTTGFLPKIYRNHDLNVVEQLDFGIRFFDFDIHYGDDGSKCTGLMTGHGDATLGSDLYQCYASATEILQGIKGWMDQNPNEVIVLYFGDLRPNSETVVPLLQSALSQVLNNQTNTQWLQNGTWPTLEESIDEQKRIYVIVREEESDLLDGSKSFIPEIQIKDRQTTQLTSDQGHQAIRVLSTFKSMNIGRKCSKIVKKSASICKRNSGAADFIKLSPFGTFLWNWKPIENLARQCNPIIEEALDKCQAGLGSNKVVNFILTDFPNYPGPGGRTVVDIADKINSQRAKKLE